MGAGAWWGGKKTGGALGGLKMARRTVSTGQLRKLADLILMSTFNGRRRQGHYHQGHSGRIQNRIWIQDHASTVILPQPPSLGAQGLDYPLCQV